MEIVIHTWGVAVTLPEALRQHGPEAYVNTTRFIDFMLNAALRSMHLIKESISLGSRQNGLSNSHLYRQLDPFAFKPTI